MSVTGGGAEARRSYDPPVCDEITNDRREWSGGGKDPREEQRSGDRERDDEGGENAGVERDEEAAEKGENRVRS